MVQGPEGAVASPVLDARQTRGKLGLAGRNYSKSRPRPGHTDLTLTLSTAQQGLGLTTLALMYGDPDVGIL